MLDCALAVRRGSFELHASMRADSGDVIALVGPNGSGKSTCLRALAGLTAAAGVVEVDGRDTSRDAVHHRAVGWVPQDGALFPHLSARDNVAFGIGGRAARARAAVLLERFGIAHLATRRPSELSGGQAQKVALARALARQPRLLLLDEPLAALDVTARADVRRTLRALLSEFDGVTILVTHDPIDIVTLANRVVALDGGRVVQDASTDEVARAPRSPWLAELMGSNAWPGSVRQAAVALQGGGTMQPADPVSGDGSAVLVVVPAHAVTLHRERSRSSSARNFWPVRVDDLVATGSRVRVRCHGEPPVVAEVTPGAVADLGLADGAEVWASVKATEVTVVPL